MLLAASQSLYFLAFQYFCPAIANVVVQLEWPARFLLPKGHSKRVSRTSHASSTLVEDVSIYHRRIQIIVTKQLLNCSNESLDA